MEDPIVGGAGDPFAQLAPQPPGAAAPAGAAPAAGADPAAGAPPQYVTVEQYEAQRKELDRLKPLEAIGQALQNPDVQRRVMGVLYGAGDAPRANAPAPIDPTVAIREKYRGIIAEKTSIGDIAGAMEASAEMGAEIGEARSAASLQAAAAPVLTQTAQTAIEGFFAAKRMDPRTANIFPKLEAKLRAFIAQTPPHTMAGLVQNGSLNAALEGAFKTTLADTYMDGMAEASAAGKLGAQPAAAVPPYGAGTRGGAPPTLPQDGLEDADEEDDKQFLDLMKKSGFNIKFSGNRSGTAIIGEIE